MSKIYWDANTGAHRVFGDDETVPPGYIDHHPHDTAKKGDDEPAASDKKLTKAEVVDALKSGGIEFPADGKVGELTELLVTKLKEALTAREIPFDENESPRDLLAKVQGA